MLQQERWVSQSAAGGGDGAPCSPFNTLAAAVAAAAALPVATYLRLCGGDYTAEGNINYDDKRLSVQGLQLFNQAAASTPTHGVFLRPFSTGDVALILEIARTNCNIAARSPGIIVFAQDAYVEALSDGTNLIDWNFNGTSPDVMRAGTQGTLAASIRGYSVGLAESVTLNGFFLSNSVVNGPLSMAGNTTTSVLRETLIQFPLIAPSAGTLWQLWDCQFPADASGVVITSNVQTDLTTYERGIRSGVTFPLGTDVVDA